MIFDRNKYGESQTIEALVPMVDLFAVLAIVFMIYATEEIIVTKMESEKRIQAIEEKVQNDRRSVLAGRADGRRVSNPYNGTRFSRAPSHPF